MNTTTTTSGTWPDPAGCHDDRLDVAGVMATTGCTPEDLADLADIFLQETPNMLRRLDEASQALTCDPASPQWPEAVEKLRTAAHELTTSFGIVGAKQAEAYSRHTQLCLRRSASQPAPLPSPEDTRTAAAALHGAVQRVGQLLKRPT